MSKSNSGDYLLVREIELSTIEAHDDNLVLANKFIAAIIS
ncbi:hypothetical protein KSS87_001249 [Heliosperma pusillum]|nr:hypothetical protein KSS87_001249 [Heliosperma pusillum]